ncbi:unnamed protein product, partial [Lampetra planeri]
MMSTGDVQGCLRQLDALLRALKYPGHVDYGGLYKGDPSAFLPILSFTFTTFSPPFAEQLVAAGFELTGKTDLRFTDTVYKVLRDIFHYKPILSKQQFLQCGFSQRKISLVCDMINLVVKRHHQLRKPRVKYPGSKDIRAETYPALSCPDPVSIRPFVINHIQNPPVFPTSPWCQEASPSHDVPSPDPPDFGTEQLAGGKESEDGNLLSAEVEGRLSAVEARLDSLLFGLDRLCVLEKRLDELERQNQDKGHDKNEEQLITISRESWENLTSRVVLLETKLELSNTQSAVPPSSSSSSSSSPSSVIDEAQQEDLMDRLQRITS